MHFSRGPVHLLGVFQFIAPLIRKEILPIINRFTLYLGFRFQTNRVTSYEFLLNDRQALNLIHLGRGSSLDTFTKRFK